MSDTTATPTRYVTYEQLTPKQRMVLDAAEKNMELAYSPYSHFRVGASLLAKDGRVFPGCNIENANYTNTQHGETTAIANAYAQGVREFWAMAIIARGETFDTEVPTPSCGYCRQSLYEAAQVSGNDIELIISNTMKTKVLIISVHELLQGAFGPLDLGIDVSKYRTLKRSGESEI
ncbi:MAG: cytidine deaminase [Candidatus Marsarchaeota archaeon]|jgi:cytidine deaminase|nr:cytidine deaminase [Candidatus Marsarchaeota archaeon]MCL5111835.1 cytidine deaminase [Candidatus Marsarchaeota archaeon]